jgi:hypothetical protein
MMPIFKDGNMATEREAIGSEDMRFLWTEK